MAERPTADDYCPECDTHHLPGASHSSTGKIRVATGQQRGMPHSEMRSTFTKAGVLETLRELAASRRAQAEEAARIRTARRHEAAAEAYEHAADLVAKIEED